MMKPIIDIDIYKTITKNILFRANLCKCDKSKNLPDKFENNFLGFY